MIGYIKGIVKYIGEGILVVGDDIGYCINILSVNYSPGDEVEFYIHTVVRENDISLWGFNSQKDLNFFKLLINVSGVGPRTAHSLISARGSNSIANAIINDRAELLKTTGVGLKTAQKIVLELKGKINQFEMTDIDNESNIISDNALAHDAMLALKSLGYKEEDLQPVISNILKNNPEISSAEEIIKLVLRNI